jgi:hypothetical protein
MAGKRNGGKTILENEISTQKSKHPGKWKISIFRKTISD